jgi:four helix bundle protein
MNNTEVTMAYDTQKPHNLDAHRIALEAAALILRSVIGTPRKLSELSDQLTRSAVSVAANLAEGAGRSGRDRSYHWRIAYGSALESRSHLELLQLAAEVEEAQAREALELLDRVCAMTWRLLHPRR